MTLKPQDMEIKSENESKPGAYKVLLKRILFKISIRYQYICSLRLGAAKPKQILGVLYILVCCVDIMKTFFNW